MMVQVMNKGKCEAFSSILGLEANKQKIFKKENKIFKCWLKTEQIVPKVYNVKQDKSWRLSWQAYTAV